MRRTVVVGWSLAALRREWNRAKQVVAPWWAQNSKEAYNSGLDGLARALDGWSKSRRGARRGRTVGFPRRKKHRCLAERSYRCDHCGVVIDRDLNAALNLAALADAASGTGSGPGTDQADLADAQGEERSMASARCSSTNCEDGASPHGPDKTATATRQRAAPKPVLIGSDR